MQEEIPDVTAEAGKSALPTAPANASKAPEHAEAVPKLNLTVAGPCKNPHGNYVGLSAIQRNKLGIEVGGVVELFDLEKSLGVFMVGTGSKELLNAPTSFTTNGVSAGTTITVRKAATKLESGSEKAFKYKVAHGVQTRDVEKHKRRVGIIAERFKDMYTEAYVTVPSALMKSLGMGEKGATVLPISKCVIRVAGVDHEIVLVPTGNDIGFTSAAAAKLGIPEQLDEITVRIDNGVLVI